MKTVGFLVLVFFCFTLQAQKIIGGSEEKSGSPIAKSIVGLEGRFARVHFTCTGIIIAPRLILTAAHCLGANNWAEITVFFSTRISSSASQMKVTKTLPLEGALPGNTDFDWHDLALLQLDKNVPSGYEPLPLVDSDTDLRDGEILRLAGYGITVPQMPSSGDGGLGVLRSVEQNVLSMSYGKTEMLMNIEKKGACSGDSGGPALLERGGQLSLVGVASRLTPRDIVSPPGKPKEYACTHDLVYTRIAPFHDWIQAAIKNGI